MDNDKFCSFDPERYLADRLLQIIPPTVMPLPSPGLIGPLGLQKQNCRLEKIPHFSWLFQAAWYPGYGSVHMYDTVPFCTVLVRSM